MAENQRSPFSRGPGEFKLGSLEDIRDIQHRLETYSGLEKEESSFEDWLVESHVTESLVQAIMQNGIEPVAEVGVFVASLPEREIRFVSGKPGLTSKFRAEYTKQDSVGIKEGNETFAPTVLLALERYIDTTGISLELSHGARFPMHEGTRALNTALESNIGVHIDEFPHEKDGRTEAVDFEAAGDGRVTVLKLLVKELGDVLELQRTFGELPLLLSRIRETDYSDVETMKKFMELLEEEQERPDWVEFLEGLGSHGGEYDRIFDAISESRED